MQKPSIKFLIIMNTIQNLPMAIGMSVTAAVLSGHLTLSINLMINILIGFVLACVLNTILPTQKMAIGIATFFRQDPDSFRGRFISNIPMSFIFTAIIGLVMSYYNVRMIPAFIFALISTFIPLYIVCFIIAMIFNPLAVKVATAATMDEKK